MEIFTQLGKRYVRNYFEASFRRWILSVFPLRTKNDVLEIKLLQILILPPDVSSLFLSLIHLFSIPRSHEGKRDIYIYDYWAGSCWTLTAASANITWTKLNSIFLIIPYSFILTLGTYT